MTVDAFRDEIAGHLVRCRPCRALLAFARRRGRADDMNVWRTLLAAHLANDRERRRTQPIKETPMTEKLVTIPADLLDDLLAESEHHAAHRPAGKLGPHAADVAATVRSVLAAGAFTRVQLDEEGRLHRRLVRLRRGPVRSGADVLTAEVADGASD